MPIGLETFLQPALQPVFDKLFTMGEDLISKFTDAELNKTLKQWKRQLRMIQAVLIDAEQKQFYSNAVKTWLDDLQDLAFDMEDIFEDFAIQVHAYELNKMDPNDVDHLANAFGVFGSVNNMVTGISDGLSTLLNPTIDEITERLQDVQSQTQYLGLSAAHFMQQQTIQTEALRNQRESTYIECEPRIYGRDDKKQVIIARLLQDDQSNEKNYVVIPIVGKGGIGKTTLAQYVYNDEEQLKGRFDIKVWVCVSDVFDVKRITTTIFKAVATDQTVTNFSNLNEAQERLKERLMGKKFMIVLDDIWNESYDNWYKLQTPFQNAAKGSIVMMTTRNVQIANLMIDESMNSTIINLEGLPDDDCWCLFQNHVNVDSDLAEMRDDIIRKCKGLPLAAKALGGLLKKAHKRHRNIILQSKTWREDSNVLPVLRLSYNHLPSHLKRMFAYCSLFPKDYTFQEMEVVLLWMAQGFLLENQPEDEGHLCFSELVSRSLFEVSRSKEGFIMHDLIHDLAVSAAHGLCYAIDTIDMPTYLKRTRHVFLTSNATTLGNELPLSSKLRTFYCPKAAKGFENLDFIRRFRYIHTLRLDIQSMEVLPEWLGDLKHLQFLSLEFRNLKELPKSMGNLWNLQTLSLIGYSKLQKLPNVRFLRKLRHLNIGRISTLEEMPAGIGELTNLQSLDKFVLGDGRGERIRDLKNLNHLHGKLTISGLRNVLKVEDAKEAQLDKKDGLYELCLCWGFGRDVVDDNSERDVLEQLKPPRFIKQLELKRYRGLTFPTWLGNPCFGKMVDIKLEHCKKCEYLPPLGQLPSLKNLVICGMRAIKQIGAEFYGNLSCQNPLFPVLESLEFGCMRSWEKWLHSPAHDHAFPCLKDLSFRDCPLWEGELPPHLPSLKKLEIQFCKELSVSLESLILLEVLKSEKCDIVSTSGNTLKTDGAGCSSDMGAECPKIPCVLAHLTALEISNSQSLISLPEGLLLPAVEHLDFWHCQNMESLPSELHTYTSLKTLNIIECPKIQEIPKGGLPINLEQLRIERVNMQRVQELAVHHLHSLRSLKLNAVGMTPEDLSLPSSLYLSDVDGSQNLETISSCTTFSNLTSLFLRDCPMFKSLVGNFTSLSYLTVRRCPNFQFCAKESLRQNLTHLRLVGLERDHPIREWGLHLLSSLESLELRDLSSSTTELVECIPSPNLQLPSSLKKLSISDFQSLESISCSSFPNLTTISIRHCLKFQSFGDHGLPPKLRDVIIEECELLKPHLIIDPDGPISMYSCRYSLL